MTSTPAPHDTDKLGKAEVNYSVGGRDHCGICRYFVRLTPQRQTGGCLKVRGPIQPHMWCRLYRKKEQTR